MAPVATSPLDLKELGDLGRDSYRVTTTKRPVKAPVDKSENYRPTWENVVVLLRPIVDEVSHLGSEDGGHEADEGEVFPALAGGFALDVLIVDLEVFVPDDTSERTVGRQCPVYTGDVVLTHVGLDQTTGSPVVNAVHHKARSREKLLDVVDSESAGEGLEADLEQALEELGESLRLVPPDTHPCVNSASTLRVKRRRWEPSAPPPMTMILVLLIGRVP